MELGFDALGVRVGRQLLAGVLCDQEQCVVLRVRDSELVGAEGADLLRGGVRVDQQGFGRAAYARFLKGYTQIVLQRDRKKACDRDGPKQQKAPDMQAEGCACSTMQLSEEITCSVFNTRAMVLKLFYMKDPKTVKN